jgi:hypothetical protein
MASSWEQSAPPSKDLLIPFIGTNLTESCFAFSFCTSLRCSEIVKGLLKRSFTPRQRFKTPQLVRNHLTLGCVSNCVTKFFDVLGRSLAGVLAIRFV